MIARTASRRRSYVGPLLARYRGAPQTAGRKARRRPKPTCRPVFERLEDRIALAVFNVNSVLDTVAVNLVTGQDATGNVSLRSANQAANAVGGNNVINLPEGIYMLSIAGAGEDAAASGDLDIKNNLTINGADLQSSILGNGIDRVFHVFAGFNVTLTKLIVRRGLAQLGGGVLNAGILTLRDDTIVSNSAFGGSGAAGADGGAGQQGAGGAGRGSLWRRDLQRRRRNLTIIGSRIASNQAIGGIGGRRRQWGQRLGGRSAALPEVWAAAAAARVVAAFTTSAAR